MNVKNFARTALDKAKKNSPELLVAIGIAGFVGTVIVAVKTTPKAVRIVEQKEKKLNRDLTKKEIVKETWKLYVPTAITGVTSIACIIGGTAKNCKIKAGLPTASPNGAMTSVRTTCASAPSASGSTHRSSRSRRRLPRAWRRTSWTGSDSGSGIW